MQFVDVALTLLASFRSGWLPLASVLLVTGCAGGPLGDSLQKSLEADPQLEEQLRFGEEAAQSEVSSSESVSTPTTVEGGTTAESAPGAENAGGDNSTTPSPSPPENPANPENSANPVPQPGDTAFIGPVPPAEWGAGDNIPAGESSLSAQVGNPSALLDEVPADLKPYVQDWLALSLAQSSTAANGLSFADIPFQPSRTITRGEYAHWLFAANNQFYGDQPAKRIRSGSANSTPAFQDVPPSHPYYSAIQGLAEAGIIPSALTGNSTAVTFRPDDPLTRENLVLWKVPLDTRTALPTATVDAVKASWGFQDAADVEPLALRAVLADRQTGDFANILRAFGFTTLFQPKKAVSQAEAAAVLWRFGSQTEGVSAKDLVQRSGGEDPNLSGQAEAP